MDNHKVYNNMCFRTANICVKELTICKQSRRETDSGGYYQSRERDSFWKFLIQLSVVAVAVGQEKFKVFPPSECCKVFKLVS